MEHRAIDEIPLHDPQDNSDQNAVWQSILPRSLLARYSEVLRRRREEQAAGRRPMVLSRTHLKVIAIGLWVLLAIGAALFIWRAIAYAGRLGAYVEFVRSGVAIEATVLGRRSAEKTSQYNPHRYAITYGFWVGGRRVIRIEGVSRQTYEAQVVDDPVRVIYLPRDPRVAIIESELVLPWPVEPGAILACCIAFLVAAHRTAKRLQQAPAESAP